MYFPSHWHRIVSVVVNILLIWNGTKKGTSIPIIINLPTCLYPPHHFYHICRNISSSWLFDGGIPTMFRYKPSGFQVKNEQNRKLGTPAIIPNLSLTPAIKNPPHQISIINTNRRQFSVLCECLFHQKTRKITHQGNEHLNWAAWLLVWALLISFGCFDDLWNHMDVYFIVMGGQGPIAICIAWVHGEGFKGLEMCVADNCWRLRCWCLCEMPFYCQTLLLTEKYKYPEVFLKGCKIYGNSFC